MNSELQRIYDSTPTDEPHSRLEPYSELILRWRRQGRTYRSIQKLLADKCAVRVGTMTVHDFVRRRSKPRKVQPQFEDVQLAAPATNTQLPASVPGKRFTPEERAAQVAYIRSLNQPTPQPQPEKPRWNFDVDKPRTIHKP